MELISRKYFPFKDLREMKPHSKKHMNHDIIVLKGKSLVTLSLYGNYYPWLFCCCRQSLFGCSIPRGGSTRTGQPTENKRATVVFAYLQTTLLMILWRIECKKTNFLNKIKSDLLTPNVLYIYASKLIKMHVYLYSM